MTPQKLIINQNVKIQGMTSHYQVLRAGKVIKDYKKVQHNLILNSGRDRVLGEAVALLDMLAYCHFGTSSTAVDVAQTGLQAYHSSTADLLEGSGNTGTYYDIPTGTTIYKKTYDSSVLLAPATITEIAVSDATGSTAATTQALNRLLLPIPADGDTGDQIRISFELQTSTTPIVDVTNAVDIIDGWDTTGISRLYHLYPADYSNTPDNNAPFGLITTTGSITALPNAGVINWGKYLVLGRKGTVVSTARGVNWNWGTAISLPLAAYGSATTRTEGSSPTNAPFVDLLAYTNGNYYRDVRYRFMPNAWNTNIAIKWLEIDGVLIIFDTAQAKNTTHRLDVYRRLTLT